MRAFVVAALAAGAGAVSLPGSAPHDYSSGEMVRGPSPFLKSPRARARVAAAA